MIGIDANLLLRLLLDDEPAQKGIVDRVLSRAGSGGLYVNLVVVAELAWVLKRGYRESPGTILDMISDLLKADQFTVERPDLIEAAISDSRKAGCGLADALIARMNEDAGAERTLTFDARAKRLPTMRDAASFR